MKNKWNWAVVVVLLLVFVAMLLPETTYSNSGPIGQIERQGGEDSSGGFNVEGIKMFFQNLALITQGVGIDVTVFFLIFGCVVMVIAVGLNHPEYLKWGRGTIMIAGVMYLVIKIGPIILYSI